MPKSKRDKKISLTRTKKKGLESKQNLVEEIRKCIDKYARIFIFTAQHIKTDKLKDMRLDWSHSKFFMGKNKVMALALGRTPEEEISDNLHKISKKLVGQTGLLFTNATKEEVMEYFEVTKYPVTPHAGDIATETVTLQPGLLQQFAHSLEPHLRKLGLPTRLERGIPELIKEHTVCVEGQPLLPNEASILKLLGKEMSFFQLRMDFCWNRNDGNFERVGKAEENGDAEDDEDDDGVDEDSSED